MANSNLEIAREYPAFSTTEEANPPNSKAVRTLSFAATALACAAAVSCGGESAPPAPVAEVRIVPDAPLVGVHDTLRLSAVLTDASGRVITGRSVAWVSSASTVVSVSSSGLAAGISKGSATVTATAEGTSAQATVTVRYIFGQVGAGTDYTCAATTGREAYCWGANNRGQLGTGTVRDTAAPAAVKDDPPISALSGNKSSGGGRHTCALEVSTVALCWGDNVSGELGDGTFKGTASPVSVAGLTNIVAVFVGNSHSCALSHSGAAYCWGWNADGQLGTGDSTDRNVPTPVVGGLAFQALALGTYHTCAIATDGRAYCWGGNPNREYGVDTTGASPVPRLVSSSLRFKRIAAGAYHTCALTQNGAAYCWGGNYEGQLGTGDTASALSPVPVVGGYTYTELAAGSYHTCALTVTNVMYCWGYNATDQLGVLSSTTFLSRTPIPAPNPEAFVAVTAGYGHTCGLTARGDIYCWGDNQRGQLGNGTNTGGPTAVQVLSP